MKALDGLLMEVVARVPRVFPWAASLSAAERRAFAVELLQAVETRDTEHLTELIEDWQSTAEALSNPQFMQAWKQRNDPRDDVPWEQVRGQLDLSRDPQAGGA